MNWQRTCVKNKSVKFIDFSRFILPYGPFPLRLIRTDVSSKPPISTLIPRSGSSVATCFYKLVSSCQKMSMSKILWYYYHCRLDSCFSVTFVFIYTKPCLLVIFTNFWRSLLLHFTVVMSVRNYQHEHCHIPKKPEILSKKDASHVLYFLGYVRVILFIW